MISSSARVGGTYAYVSDAVLDEIVQAYRNACGRRISLPGYCFDRKSYYLQIRETGVATTGLNATQAQAISFAANSIPRKETQHLQSSATAGNVADALFALLQEVYHGEALNPAEKITALDLDSINMMQLVGRVKRAFNVDVPYKFFFEDRTIAELCSTIDEMVCETKKQPDPIQPAKARELYPVSSAQKRIFVLQEYAGSSNTAYNLPGAFRIEGKLDVERVQSVLQCLVERHEALRTSFILHDGAIMQQIQQKVNFTVEIAGPKAEAESEQQLVLRKEMAEFVQPFDLTHAPLFRVKLIPLAGEQHLLLFDMHHIISDGQSRDILVRELLQLYRGEGLPALRIQYKDFAVWQNDLLNTHKFRKQEEFWLQTFAGDLPVLDLPTDMPRPALQSFTGETLHMTLSRGLSGQLRALAKAEGVTLYMLLLAVYTYLLNRYSGQEAIVVGSPIAGRHHADLEGVVGMFVNTLAMLNWLKGEEAFGEYLSRVRENCLRAYENQDYPLEMLLERLPLQRDASRNPLFDTMFVLQNIPVTAMTLPGLKISREDLANPVAKFDLTLTVQEADELICQLEYSTALFKRPTMERLLGHFQRICEAIVVQPACILREIPLLTVREEEQLLIGFNQTQADFPQEKTVLALFLEQVRRSPAKTAVSSADGDLSYWEFYCVASNVARRLMQKGVQKEEPVAIMLHRSLQMLTGIYGIMLAGGAYLPIDPAYPAERVEYMLQDSGARVLVTCGNLPEGVAFAGEVVDLSRDGARESGLGIEPGQVCGRTDVKGVGNEKHVRHKLEHLLAKLTGVENVEHGTRDIENVQHNAERQKAKLTGVDNGEYGAREMENVQHKAEYRDTKRIAVQHLRQRSIDGEQVQRYESPKVVQSEGVNEEEMALWLERGNPRSLAYIIYTSGSTGKPKGTLIELRSVVNRLIWMQKQYPLTGDDVIMQKTPFTFDVSVWELFWWAIVGARVSLLTPGGEKEPEEIIRAIEEERVTVLHFVPSMFNAFLEYLAHVPVQGRLDSLRRVFVSGEALQPAQVARFNRYLFRPNGTTLHNLYGPTEATVDVTYYDCQPGVDEQLVPIGKPIDNTQIYIVNRWNQLQPIGIPGELCIAGVGLARGYLQKPELTAAKFVANPFTTNTRMYKTGDLARWLPDGHIEYLGRLDNQVKIRGLRIELGEIEAQLLSHQGVKEAVVVDRATQDGEKYLCAYVVMDGAVGPDTREGLQKYLAESLPEYMVPAQFSFLAALPLSTNGKINRKALPAPEMLSLSKGEYRVPQTAVEHKLVRIWQEVLQVPEIGVEDNFFELGGDSIKGLHVVARYGGGFLLADLFRHPTVAGLAEVLEGGKAASGLLQELTPRGEEAKVSLVCIPYGGGNAVVYQPLANALTGCNAEIAVYAVAIPGHDPGQPLQQLQPLRKLAEACAAEIKSRCQTPVVLYGHCVGSALTLEIARLLALEPWSEGRLQAVCLGGHVLKGQGGLLKPSLDPWKDVSDEEIHAFLQGLGGFGGEMAPETRALVLRAFRHDVRCMAEFFYGGFGSGGARLTVPLICIVGERDPLTRGAWYKHRRWRRYAADVQLRKMLGGGHYFVEQQAQELAAMLVEVAKGSSDGGDVSELAK